MFTQSEENYIKALINTYSKQGYNYYLCHTITEIDNNYDICLYLSKEEIKANSSTDFNIKNAIVIYIDSSSRNDNAYNYSIHSRDYIYNSNFTGSLSVNQAEFIYTNSVITYTETSSPINPDLLLQNTNSWLDLKFSISNIILLVSLFLFLFFSSILRLRK